METWERDVAYNMAVRRSDPPTPYREMARLRRWAYIWFMIAALGWLTAFALWSSWPGK